MTNVDGRGNGGEASIAREREMCEADERARCERADRRIRRSAEARLFVEMAGALVKYHGSIERHHGVYYVSDVSWSSVRDRFVLTLATPEQWNGSEPGEWALTNVALTSVTEVG